MRDKITPIGIFYDGTYFQHVTNHYAHDHPLRDRLSIEGLHRFVAAKTAELEGTDERYCRVVESHYFRGRLSAPDAHERDLLYGERVFDDVLMRAGVTTHYLPLSGGSEKGVDVRFALEAYEAALHKGLGVVVLLTGDGDHLPLVRKLAGLGTRVMVLGFELESTTQDGEGRTLRAAKALMEEATYTIHMADLIEEAYQRGDSLPDDLFVKRESSPGSSTSPAPPRSDADHGESPPAERTSANGSGGGKGGSDAESGPGAAEVGGVCLAQEESGALVHMDDRGYGFIKPHAGGEDLFFFRSEVENVDFEFLGLYQRVSFRRSANERGPCAVGVRIS